MYGGLEWLGMQLVPDDIYHLVRYIDKHKDGRKYIMQILRLLFVVMIMIDELIEQIPNQNNETMKQLIIHPKIIPELYINKDQERLEKREAISVEILLKK